MKVKYSPQPAMFEDYPDVLTIKDVMKALRIGRHAVYRLISSDKLRGFKIGCAYKITKDSLIRFIEQMNTQGEK